LLSIINIFNKNNVTIPRDDWSFGKGILPTLVASL